MIMKARRVRMKVLLLEALLMVMLKVKNLMKVSQKAC